LLNHEFDKIPL